MSTSGDGGASKRCAGDKDPHALRVVLMGDDIFDDYENRTTVNTKRTDVAMLLDKYIDIGKHSVEVSSCAVGNSVVANVSGSIWPDSKRKTRRKAALMPAYPVESKDGHVHPLRFLSEKKATHAILSIGWNDIKMHFFKSLKVDDVCASVAEVKLEKQLASLVNKITKIVKRLIIVFMPLPHATRMHHMFRLPPTKDVMKIFAQIASAYHNVAIRHRVPIVDLSRSIDPFDASSYISEDPTRLSTKARGIVASVLASAITKYDFDGDGIEPSIFSGPGNSRIRVDPLNRSIFSGSPTSYETLLKHFVFDCEHSKKKGCIVS